MGPDSFTYEVNDGKGGTATAIVSINMCVSSRGLAAYYPFNNNAKDESGNGNDGKVFGATPTADRTGRGYSAYRFDGDNDYTSAEQQSSIYSATFSAWVRNLGIPFADGTRNHIITLSSTTPSIWADEYQYFFRMGGSVRGSM